MSDVLSTRQFMQAAAALQQKEMDGLALFRPTEAQEEALRRMSQEHCLEVLIVAGNRAGKSVLAAVYFASFIRDVPITFWSGEQVYARPERLRGQSINAWIIGDHLKHLGMTIYRLLFDEEASKGLFKIIRDESTGAWRAWNPAMFENDWERKNDARWAPPVIPPSEITEIAWAIGRKREHEFRTIKMNNKSTIHGFASSGEVKQGDAVDVIWNDESIHSSNKHYYQEWLARLRDDEGRMIWSTIPRDECWVFSSVIERLEQQEQEVERGERDPSEHYTAKIELSYLDSPFIPERQKQLALEQAGERDALVRVYGKRSSRLIAVYQDYSPSFHVAMTDDENLIDPVHKMMEENNWVPPHDWTRELVLDPGTQKPAILLGAVPPPSLWDHDEPYFIVYKEIFIRRASPAELAEQVMLLDKDSVFERFIIDGRMGRQRPPGFVETVDYQYQKAFAAAGLKSRQTGSGFIAGDDDFSRRSKAVIRSMRSRECGRPQLRIVNKACPNLVKQLQSNVRKTTRDGEPMEEAAANQIDDLRVCLEYWISRRPTFQQHLGQETEVHSPAMGAYLKNMSDAKERQQRERQLTGTNTFSIGVPA